MLQISALPYKATDPWVQVMMDGTPKGYAFMSKMLFDVPVRGPEQTHVYPDLLEVEPFGARVSPFREAHISDITRRGTITVTEDELQRLWAHQADGYTWFEVLESKIRWEDDPHW